MTNRKELGKEILKISEGVTATLTDFLLFTIFFGVQASFRSPTSRGTWQAYNSAFDELDELNYQTIKKALYNMKGKGLIRYTRESIIHPRITKQGLKRLRSIIPEYDQKRIWDGKIYLVTYDIPEDERLQRDTLRFYLEKIGCGKLQNSVWITPYNPQDTLSNFIEQNDLEGSVIISEVGNKNSVGKERIEELVSRVYKLEELNERYKKFVKKYSQAQIVNSKTKSKIIFEFLSILFKDPQIPFKLLPKDWVGEEAYKIFKIYSK